jgi:hypothetical protein
MAKYVLENVYDFDFSLLAITSSEPDYKLCIHLNRALHLNLVRESPVDLNARNMKTALTFSCFAYQDEEEFNEYMLLSNRSINSVVPAADLKSAPSLFDEESPADIKGYLVPELAQYDFLLLIKGEMHETLAQDIQAALKNITFVQAARLVAPAGLNSKKNLLI